MLDITQLNAFSIDAGHAADDRKLGPATAEFAC